MRNVLYTMMCMTCAEAGERKVYHGESHRTLYDRAWEHWDGLKNQTEDSVLTRHWREDHPGTSMAPKFSIKLVETCRTSTERQIKESLLIDGEDTSNLINNKSEWGQNPVPRQVTDFGDKKWEEDDKEDPEAGRQRQGDSQKEVGRQEGNPFEKQFSQRRRKIREEKKLERERLEACAEDTQLADKTDNLRKTIRDIRQTGRLLEPVQIEEQTAGSRKRQRTGSVNEKSNVIREQFSQRSIRAMFRKDRDLKSCPGRQISAGNDDW